MFTCPEVNIYMSGAAVQLQAAKGWMDRTQRGGDGICGGEPNAKISRGGPERRPKENADLLRDPVGPPAGPHWEPTWTALGELTHDWERQNEITFCITSLRRPKLARCPGCHVPTKSVLLMPRD
ncbi:hypothetical protein EYF80_002981 [Liparis tanakae]|uniref:Uncharacterized protein n=1 Tax=Liparis tanakae TaxID=230148 RepID=A0A4Z2JAW1_9TELE|nr:hypothetical protein EYF80_002981 [Liparis tanakae]